MNADFEQKATKGTKMNRGFREWAKDGDDALFRGLRRAWEFGGAGERGTTPGGQLENPRLPGKCVQILV